MHSIHFGFSLGTVIGPLMAAPFLSMVPDHKFNATDADTPKLNGSTAGPGVVYIYIIVGIVSILSGTGFVMPAIKACKETSRAEITKEDESSGEQKKMEKLVAFILLMCLFFFSYEGIEVASGAYLATFAVKSGLQGTKLDGAYVTTVYWGTFAIARFLSIFLAVHLNPMLTHSISLTLCLSGSIGLMFLAEHSLLALEILAAIIGCGVAPLFATGLLWMEKHIVVSNRIGAACSFSVMSAFAICPVVVGSSIVDSPMVLVYVLLANSILCILTLAAAWKLVSNKPQSRNISTSAS